MFVVKVALQLLDYQIADEDVRRLGVKRLEELPNDELELYLLQLVQVMLCLCVAMSGRMDGS